MRISPAGSLRPFLCVLFAIVAGGSLRAQDTTIIRLEEEINDSNAIYTYAPAVTADGLGLYFVSDRPGGIGGQDLWFTTKTDPRDTLFSTPVNLGPYINSSESEGTVSISADGRMIFFSACNRADGAGGCDIYESHREGDVWTPARSVKELNTAFWDAQPSISADGRTIFFTSNRGGLTGGEDGDIYFATKGADGTWRSPERLPYPITTTAMEGAPYSAPDGSLYFVSDRSGGLGGVDFYVSRQNPDGSWRKPVNLGAPINSPRDEDFITMSGEGDVIYFSSERDQESKLALYMALLPSKSVVVRVAGRVYDRPSGRGVSAGLVVVDSASGQAIGGTVADSSGGYALEVKVRHPMPLDLYLVADGYAPVRNRVTLSPEHPSVDVRSDFPLNADDDDGLLPDVRLFPNPAVSTLTVDCSSGKYEAGSKHLAIQNAMGEELLATDFSADHITLKVDDLESGVYLLRVGDNLSAFIVRK